MSSDDLHEDRDLEYLFERLEQPVEPSPEFRLALEEDLQGRLAERRGEGTVPEGWALCPFDVFCVAKQRLPSTFRRNCPCLHAAPILHLLKNQSAAIHVRPCAGIALRKANTPALR